MKFGALNVTFGVPHRTAPCLFLIRPSDVAWVLTLHAPMCLLCVDVIRHAILPSPQEYLCVGSHYVVTCKVFQCRSSSRSKAATEC
ncbi:hypothetical protein QQP08_007805 [Theobroma cacao]|nr:hypothetical protein QQP08_007805 [Theobroma cacao]